MEGESYYIIVHMYIVKLIIGYKNTEKHTRQLVSTSQSTVIVNGENNKPLSIYRLNLFINLLFIQLWLFGSTGGGVWLEKLVWFISLHGNNVLHQPVEDFEQW